MRIRGQTRGARALLLFLTGLLGAAAVVLPAVASSEAAGTIEAKDSEGVYKEQIHRWLPAETAASAGNSLTFKNPNTKVNHGVEWRPGNPSTPSCSSVPGASVGQASFGTAWSGTCTFTQPGKYEYWCTVHGSSMSGTITVNASGTPTTTTTTAGTQTTTSGGGSSTTPSGASAPHAGLGASGSPLAGSISRTVKLLSSQHGRSVRGSVAISQAGEGGSLEVDLFAKSASLASGAHASGVRVGKLVLSHLRAGKVAFSVPLNSRARAALRRHRRLALSARIVIQPMTGSAVTVTRSAVLHA
jgi:plastocyanin